MLKITRCASTIYRFTGQILREKSSYQISSVGVKTIEQPKSLPQNYNEPFSYDLSAELRRENAQFMLVFPDVIHHLTKFTSSQYELRDASKHFAKALEYNVPHGKKIRGLTAVIVYKDLFGKHGLTPKHIQQAHILGWCIELLQSVFLMSDDMIDCSQIRRNKPCWYMLDDVKSVAVNDVFMIENGCYLLLRKFFGHLPCYQSLFELLHETAMNTFIGQSLDYQIGNGNIEQFSIEKHISISNYKTGHFAFYTPIALPMLLAGYKNAKMFEDIKTICYELGHFYQVQNDFLDCFSDTDVLKKPGTDIEDGKCTWLAVSAMEHALNEQKDILIKCYGQNDPESVNQVKQIYSDLDLPQLYSQYEEKTYNKIKCQIVEFSQQHDLPPNILLKTLNRTFNRT
ncbi:farnesyl pyrophosphate synthase-like [Contarinia nasturtii]|uniref:farnesyl pyrophosphate synthase-like n=1 Tax=Contarinia nasturtii TaxID=265458 RepID=UPI0012D3B11A|nr:farnesyl pyrophosphate synthase-like [Contarinia nasturtii]